MSDNNYRKKYIDDNPFEGTEHSEMIEEAQRLRREKRNSSISPRAARRRKAALEREVEEKARKSFVSGRRITFGVAIIAVVALVVISGINIFELRTSAANEEAALALKQEEKERLESEYAMINDLEYIETQAREKLRMIKPGEILYVFKDKETEEE